MKDWLKVLIRRNVPFKKLVNELIEKIEQRDLVNAEFILEKMQLLTGSRIINLTLLKVLDEKYRGMSKNEWREFKGEIGDYLWFMAVGDVCKDRMVFNQGTE